MDDADIEDLDRGPNYEDLLINNSEIKMAFVDKVYDFFDSGEGPIEGPYGGTYPGDFPVSVTTDIVLGKNPGSVATFLSLPTGSFVTVGFAKKKIIDGPGDDIFIQQATATEAVANVFVSSNLKKFQFLGAIEGQETSAFDLSSIEFTKPVKAIKIVGLDNDGGSPGFDIASVEVPNSSLKNVATRKPNRGINGNNKNNRLQGTNKGDLIDGKNGNDTLIGAAGNDTLTGGGGADDFLLGSGKVYRKRDLGIDKITDFQRNVDDIILDTETFITLKSKLGEGFSIGREFEIVKNKRAVAGSLADIVYDSSKGDLYYNPNSALPGFGGGGKIATLEGAPKISASDFVLE